MTPEIINVYNLIILDESGSMRSIYNQALSGINETLATIRSNQEIFPLHRNYVSIVTFEGDASGVKLRRDRIPVGSIKDMTAKDYAPGGCTPLYDAMGISITRLAESILPNDRVMVTIITDGEENSSTRYSGKAIKEMVSRQREKGWTFAYIGANQDAVEVARELNINNALNFDATPEGTVEMSVRFRKASAKYAVMMDSCPAECADMSGLFDED